MTSLRYSTMSRSSLSEQFQDYAWVAHPKRVWDFVRIVRRSTGETGAPELQVISVQWEEEGVQTVLEADTFPFDPSHSAMLDDLCGMNNLHEAPLLYTLEKRLERNSIYTSASNIVISINPYRGIPDLFDSPLDFYVAGKVAEAGPRLERPHVYAVANKVLSSLVNAGPDDMKNQSVVISGESGAGKTEASKYVMRFLIAVNDASLPTGGAALGDVGARIREVLVDTNVVLEAFGNAKTVRNDNSSRFGKYTKLQYTDDNKLSSAHTQTFLLEKSRLTSVGPQERNYHVLYQVAKGADASLDRVRLGLSTVDDFQILTSGGCTVAGREDNDVELFSELCGALRTLGASATEVSSLWELLAAILHMGNLRVEGGDGECGISAPSMSLEGISALLGCNEDDFRRALLYHVVKVSTRSSVSMKQLTPEETSNNILALMKWLYNGIFSWLVRKLNAAYGLNGGLDAVGAVTKFIGILDIFGFETLLSNSFEQLCINFANERLQQQFNEQVFVFEQIEYEKEGLNWSSVTFRDNQPVIDLISKKPSGLLNILEEHGMMNRKPDDNALLMSYGQQHYQKHPAYDKPRIGAETFIVKHFAGNVSYNIAGFLSKNNDSLQDDLLELIRSSQNRFLLNAMGLAEDSTSPGFVEEGIAVAESAAPAAPKAAGPAGGKKMASAMTVSFHFRHQLDDLVATLRATKPHYIKCLKPNTHKSPEEFDPTLVMEQLRYSGILEVVRIRREGYPTRMQFRDFYNKFYLLGYPQGLPRPVACASCDEAEIKRLAAAVAAVGLGSEDPSEQNYQVGHNKMFLRDGGLGKMSLALLKFKKKYCLKIQSWLRCKQASRVYKVSRYGALLFQKSVRRYLARKRLQERRSAWLVVNRHVSREYRRRKAARFVQAYRAEVTARRLEEEARRAAAEARRRLEMSHKIQLWVSSRARQRVVRRRFAVARKALCLIQNRGRILLAKKARIRLQKEKFAGAVRSIMAFAHTARSRQQQRRSRRLLEMIVTDDGEGVVAHLAKYPSDESIVLRTPGSLEFRSAVRMMAYFGCSSVLQCWQLSRSRLVELDRNGRHCFHHWAMGPCPDIGFAIALMSRCKTSIMSTRTSVTPNSSSAGAAHVLKEGWLRKKRPGNKFEKRWAALEATSTGIKLSYFKSKGDKASKGEVDMQRSEEALTVRRVPLEETTGATDELFQFEIFSPIGLAHKSKSPIMYFNVANEVELHEWLAPIKHGIANRPVSPNKDGDRASTLRPGSIETTGALGVSRKFRPQFCSDADVNGNSPAHLMCMQGCVRQHVDTAVQLIFESHGMAPPASHYLRKSLWHRKLQRCSAVSWILGNCNALGYELFSLQNDKDQNLLHMAGIGGDTVLCEVLVSIAVRACVHSANHSDDAAKLANFILGKDTDGRAPKAYADSRPLDIADISLSDSADWSDSAAAVARAASYAGALPALGLKAPSFGGLSYLTVNFLSFDVEISSGQTKFPTGDGKCSFPVRLFVRSLSTNGYWLTDMITGDISESVLSIVEPKTGGGAEKKLLACLGCSWELSVPLQNFEEGAVVLVELRRCDDDSAVGWTYIRLSSDVSKLDGLNELHVFAGGCPAPLGPGLDSPGSPISLPAFPASTHDMALQVEMVVQCA